MFSIYADDKLLYSTLVQEGSFVLSPTCTEDIGKAGVLDFTLIPGHPLYGDMKKLKTKIRAYKGTDEIFNGRVLNWDVDFYKQKVVHCEGNLAYLLDTLQPPRTVEMTVTQYFDEIIKEHNLQVELDKMFVRGIVASDFSTITDKFTSTEYRNTREALDSDLIGVFGGFLRTRSVSDVTYLDYIKEYDGTNSQKLEFSSNILDMSESISADELFTVLLPTGATTNALSNDPNAPAWPLTIETVNDGSKLLENTTAIAKYGRIVKSQEFGWVTDPAELKSRAEEFMALTYLDAVTAFTIKALDLSMFDTTIDSFSIGKKISITSLPHDVNVILTCLAIAYDFENFENTTLTIGALGPDYGSRLTSEKNLSTAVGAAVGGKDGGVVGKAQKNIKALSAVIEKATIGTARIRDAAITNAKIEDAAITNAKIKDAEIETAKIKDAAITKAKIGTAAIGTANIEDAAITRAKIGTAVIGTANIENAAITTVKIEDAAITDAKISTATVQNLIANSIIAAVAEIDKVIAGDIDTYSLYAHIIRAVNAEIKNVTSGVVTTNDLYAEMMIAVTAEIGRVDSETMITSDLYAEIIKAVTANIEQVTSGMITTNDLYAQIIKATIAEIKNISADTVDTNDLYAAFAKVVNLSVTTAGIDLAYIKNVAADEFIFDTGVVGELSIRKLVVADANIRSVSASKLTAGTIDALDINVINLNAASITVGQINGQQIAPGSVNAQHITNGAITGDKIDLGAISAQKLNLSQHIIF